jgi:3-oxoacyl-[acyl-carrier protein] reductase
MELKNKTALVTGSSSGIGRAIVLALAKERVGVIVNSRKNVKGGIEVANKITKHGGQAIYIQGDLSNKEDVGKLFNSALKVFKRIDILVNNAGESISGELEDLEVWKYQLNNILLSAVIATGEFLKIENLDMRKIVNITSIYGSAIGSNTDYLAYGAAKAGLNNLTVNLAKKLGSSVLVNAVAPGWTWTPPWGKNRKKEERSLRTKLAIGRFVEPEEIAQTVVMILKNDAITGQVVTVDGGASLKDLY